MSKAYRLMPRQMRTRANGGRWRGASGGLLVLLLLLSANPVSVVLAQDWPSKPVRLVVGVPAGGAPDIAARLIADRLTQAWGQSVIVDNRPGAATNIATAAVAKAPPDGYQILFGTAAGLALNRLTFQSVSFDVAKDFTPIVGMGISPMFVVVGKDQPLQTVRDLVNQAQAKPGKINYATPSSRNIPHLVGEMINTVAGVRMVNVPYSTPGQIYADLSQGQVQVYIDGIPAMLGKERVLRVIATASAKRLANFPDVPAVAEALPSFPAVQGWFAIVGPAKLPAPIVAKINRDVNAAVQVSEIRQRLLDLGVYNAGGTPEELASFMKAERDVYAQAVKAAGIEPQ